jgi:hypothetical protein
MFKQNEMQKILYDILSFLLVAAAALEQICCSNFFDICR